MTGTWNNFNWNSGILWGPAITPVPGSNNTKHKTTRMKRQEYYPSRLASQPEWLINYATRLLEFGPALGLSTPVVAASVADALYLAHGLGTWITAVRDFGPGCTAALETLMTGGGGAPFDLPA